MKKSNLLTICSLMSLPFSIAIAGQDRGGGNPSRIDEASIRLLLEGGGLKQAMLNYLKTLSLDEMDESTPDAVAVKGAFQRMMKGDALQQDIQAAFYVGMDQCRDGLDQTVPAAAQIGELASRICFDVSRLATEFSGLASEEVMIKLASLAFHEHVHHFQSPRSELRENESEAYTVSAYVQLTAKTIQIPLLEWNDPRSREPSPAPGTETALELRRRCEQGVDNFFEAQRQRVFNVVKNWLNRHPESRVKEMSVDYVWKWPWETTYDAWVQPDHVKRIKVRVTTVEGISLVGTALIGTENTEFSVVSDRAGRPVLASCRLKSGGMIMDSLRLVNEDTETDIGFSFSRTIDFDEYPFYRVPVKN